MKPAAKTRTPKPARRKPASGSVAANGHAPAFREIIGLIHSVRQRAYPAANRELIGLNWRVGEYISRAKGAPVARQFSRVTPAATQLRSGRHLHESYQRDMHKTE